MTSGFADIRKTFDDFEINVSIQSTKFYLYGFYCLISTHGIYVFILVIAYNFGLFSIWIV